MKTKKLSALFLFFFLPFVSVGQQANYLSYVQEHTDQLLQYGKDHYGKRQTKMLAAVIDTRDMSVPFLDVPATLGTRRGDRAVGGSNLYHDVEMIRILKALSETTGDKKYEDAMRDYLRDYLEYAQNPETGLLGWGEHTYYNFYTDTVMEATLELNSPNKAHEFLENTPPWEALFQIDPKATERAIEGVRYHFRSPTTQSFLFNRHANWFAPDHTEYRGLERYQGGGQAWIKHSGLQCYSFSYLYAKTGDPEWKRWAEGTGSLYWKYRHPSTNLVVSCIDDPRPEALASQLDQTSLLCYYLLKSSQLSPDLGHLKEKAEHMLKAAERYSWDAARMGYCHYVNIDGSPQGSELFPVVSTGYGAPDLLAFGRIAAYFYKVTEDPSYLEMVKKVFSLLEKQSWPESFVINSLAESVQFSLDAYEIAGEKKMLDKARQLADIGIRRLWTGKLFVRQTSDPYYEAKLKINAFVAGLLRLYYLSKGDSSAASLLNWSL